MRTVVEQQTEVTYDLLGLSWTEADAIRRVAGALLAKNNPLMDVYNKLNAAAGFDGGNLGPLRATTIHGESTPVYVLFFKSQAVDR